MGLHDPARPNHCTPMPTNLFLVELSVNATNWFLFSIVASSMALSFSGIVTVTGGIHGGLGYASMLSRLDRSQEENLTAVFCSGEIQVLFARLIARLAFQNRWPSGLVCHLIQVLSTCRCSLACVGTSDASDSAIRRETVQNAPVIAWAPIF